ncbi:MAG: class I SAM-dependent methyltransferase [Opitutales bacterium]
MPSNWNFDRIAFVYRFLEIIAFGPYLQKARIVHINELAQADDVLLVGEGHGLFLKALLEMNTQCRVTCVDASQAMLQLARKRIKEKDRYRVSFEQLDLAKVALPLDRHDAIVTHFFMDCFNRDTLERLIPMLTATLQPAGKWLLADFEEPPRGSVLSLFQRIGLRVLYSFFKASCGIEASALGNPREILLTHGIQETKRHCYLNEWIASVVYEKMHTAMPLTLESDASSGKTQKT